MPSSQLSAPPQMAMDSKPRNAPAPLFGLRTTHTRLAGPGERGGGAGDLPPRDLTSALLPMTLQALIADDASQHDRAIILHSVCRVMVCQKKRRGAQPTRCSRAPPLPSPAPPRRAAKTDRCCVACVGRKDPPCEDPPFNGDPPFNDPPFNDPPLNDPPLNDPPLNDPPLNDPPPWDMTHGASARGSSPVCARALWDVLSVRSRSAWQYMLVRRRSHRGASRLFPSMTPLSYCAVCNCNGVLFESCGAVASVGAFTGPILWFVRICEFIAPKVEGGRGCGRRRD